MAFPFTVLVLILLSLQKLIFILTKSQDNYKVVVFGDDNFGLDGRELDHACRMQMIRIVCQMSYFGGTSDSRYLRT